MVNEKIESRKKEFIRELKDQTYTERYIVQKYLCNGYSPILDEETIFLIKYKIASEFDIHPNEIFLTGSAQLGFSIAPKNIALHKKFIEFNCSSDIDIAIISNNLFERYWSELLDFNIHTESRTEEDQKIYYKFLEYLFRGWIRPDKFPFKFEGKNDWFDFFRALTIEFNKIGNHKIAAGIYKSFDTFELYNIENINRIRKQIKEGEIKL